MSQRIVIDMEAAWGAEARLWALVNQRRVDVTRAWFEKDRQDHRIRATLEVELDMVSVHRLIRQLRRHHDIQHIALESERRHFGQGPIHAAPRRLHIATKKGACL